MTFDLSRLGPWADLPFFRSQLPEIADTLAGQSYLPAKDAVFAALERCWPDATRVIILGQDPYHTPGKPDGLAFSIPHSFGGRLDSLGNIFKEIANDLGETRRKTSLQDWADQGVLLLNTVLTVLPGQAHSHRHLGWQTLTQQVLHHLAGHPRAYLLWGKPAQTITKGVDPASNLKVETAHPSPLSAHRGFFGSAPFSKTNQWLMEQGYDPIRWGDPE